MFKKKRINKVDEKKKRINLVDVKSRKLKVKYFLL